MTVIDQTRPWRKASPSVTQLLYRLLFSAPDDSWSSFAGAVRVLGAGIRQTEHTDGGLWHYVVLPAPMLSHHRAATTADISSAFQPNGVIDANLFDWGHGYLTLQLDAEEDSTLDAVVEQVLNDETTTYQGDSYWRE